MDTFEINFDGLIGPTHHYAGLAIGNMASHKHAKMTANPKAAALQGIAKMRLMHKLGIQQGILPPQQRPNLHLLHQLGFQGSPMQQINRAYKYAPELLSACYSAASMWAANSATVSASSDTADNRVHFTPANLTSHLHRQQEAVFSGYLLSRIFVEPQHFCHHAPLPCTATTSDEGAANHCRLSKDHSSPGINLFVYGKSQFKTSNTTLPQKYPARQSLEASQSIARLHGLDEENTIYAQQNPTAIDLGVFHNDVIAVANENMLFIHEEAFVDQQSLLNSLLTKNAFLKVIEVSTKQLTLEEAVESYLFNSQLVTLPGTNHDVVLIAPKECKHHKRVSSLIDSIISDNTNPIRNVYYVDLKQSMQNGGGPACLRLRVPLNHLELQAMHSQVMVNESLLDDLEAWILRHYRDRLNLNDFGDPAFIDEVFYALDELSILLDLRALYPFQKELTVEETLESSDIAHA